MFHIWATDLVFDAIQRKNILKILEKRGTDKILVETVQDSMKLLII